MDKELVISPVFAKMMNSFCGTTLKKSWYFSRKGSKIYASKVDEGGDNIMFNMTLDDLSFNFPSEDITFIDFSEFVHNLSIAGFTKNQVSCELATHDAHNCILIKSGRNKIFYKLGSVGAFSSSYKFDKRINPEKIEKSSNKVFCVDIDKDVISEIVAKQGKFKNDSFYFSKEDDSICINFIDSAEKASEYSYCLDKDIFSNFDELKFEKKIIFPASIFKIMSIISSPIRISMHSISTQNILLMRSTFIEGNVQVDFMFDVTSKIC